MPKPPIHATAYRMKIEGLSVSHGDKTVSLGPTTIDFPRELEKTEDGALIPKCNYAHQLFKVPGFGTLEIGIHFGKVPVDEEPQP